MPATLTLGNNFWMFYPNTPKWNEAIGSFEISPLSNLSVTLSGAYKADLIGPERKDPRGNTLTENFDGYMARVDAEYEALGLTFTPFVSYEVDSYADKTVHNINGEPVRVDTTIGLAVAGSPIDDLTLAAEASYKAEEPQTILRDGGSMQPIQTLVSSWQPNRRLQPLLNLTAQALTMPKQISTPISEPMPLSAPSLSSRQASFPKTARVNSRQALG